MVTVKEEGSNGVVGGLVSVVCQEGGVGKVV